MIEFTNIIQIQLIKTDLGLEKEMAKLLGGGDDPGDFYSAYLDENVLNHFSATWTILAPVSSWEELSELCSTPPLEMSIDEDLFYVPGILNVDDEEELDPESTLVVAHIEENTEDAYGKYRDMIEAGVSEDVAGLVLPPNKMKKKMVTLTGHELLQAVISVGGEELSSDTRTIVIGMGAAFESCSPIISSVMGGNNAFKGD